MLQSLRACGVAAFVVALGMASACDDSSGQTQTDTSAGEAGTPGASDAAGSSGAPSDAGAGGSDMLGGSTGMPAAGADAGSADAGSSGTPATTGNGGTSNVAGSGGAVNIGSLGCGQPAPVTVATQQTLPVAASMRSYFVAPPSGYDNKVPYALLFALHGTGGSGQQLRGVFPIEAATAGNAIVVYPDAQPQWDLKNDGVDVAFLDALIAHLESQWCIDSHAIFVSGFSYGAFEADQLADARPLVLRGIAAIEGMGPVGGMNTDPAVAAIIIHGVHDSAVPLTAGEASRDHFLATNGCSALSTATDPSPCVSYSGCKPQTPVTWCAGQNGHEIPDFAATAIWKFFSSLRSPG